MASSVLDPSGSSPQQLPAADVVVRTECKPGNKVCCAGPPRHVAADLTEQGQRVFHYTWHLISPYSEEVICVCSGCAGAVLPSAGGEKHQATGPLPQQTDNSRCGRGVLPAVSGKGRKGGHSYQQEHS